jgi:hypothetical protein
VTVFQYDDPHLNVIDLFVVAGEASLAHKVPRSSVEMRLRIGEGVGDKEI